MPDQDSTKLVSVSNLMVEEDNRGKSISMAESKMEPPESEEWRVDDREQGDESIGNYSYNYGAESSHIAGSTIG